MQIERSGRRMLCASAALCAAHAANALAADSAPSAIGVTRLAHTALSLAGVVALIIVLAYIVRRFQRTPTGGGLLKVIDSLTLGARERILLLEADGERLVIGIVAGRIHALHVLGQIPKSPASFAANLHATLQTMAANREVIP